MNLCTIDKKGGTIKRLSLRTICWSFLSQGLIQGSIKALLVEGYVS